MKTNLFSPGKVFTGVVPFRKGELKNVEHLSVEDSEMILQSRALAYHCDDSVKLLEYNVCNHGQKYKGADFVIDEEKPNPKHAQQFPASAVINFSYLAVPSSVFLTAQDHKGHTYVGHISRPFNDDLKFFRKGPNRVTVRVSGLMKPLEDGKQTYDHLFAFDANIDHYNNTDCFGLRIRLHNGNLDNPNGDVYFKSVHLWVPNNQVVRSEWSEKDPVNATFMDESAATHHFVAYALVEPPKNSLDNHLMLQNGQRLWSVTVGSPSHTDHDVYFKDEQRVNVVGVLKRYGEIGYGPTSVPVPFDSGYKQLQKDIEELSDSRPVGFYDMIHSPYGGPTGLWRVVLNPGTQLIKEFEDDEFTHFRRGAYRYAARQPTYMAKKDGSRWSRHDYKDENGNSTVRLYDGKIKNNLDGMGLQKALEEGKIKNAGITCTYENELRSWMPIDLKHAGILAYCWIPLYWLTGDPVAEDFLLNQGELCALHWGDHKYISGGLSYLRSQMEQVEENPHTGSSGGRDFGWAMYFVANAHQINPFTQDWIGWLNAADQVVSVGQMLENGALYCNSAGKGAKVWYDYKYYVTQPMETGIEMNGYKAVVEAIGSEVAPRVFYKFITGACKYFWRNKDHTNGCWVTFPVATAPDKNLFAAVEDIPEGDLPSKENCPTCPPWGETQMTPGMFWLFSQCHQFFSHQELDLLLVRLLQLYGTDKYHTSKNYLYWCGNRAMLDNYGFDGSLVVVKKQSEEAQVDGGPDQV